MRADSPVNSNCEDEYDPQSSIDEFKGSKEAKDQKAQQRDA